MRTIIYTIVVALAAAQCTKKATIKLPEQKEKLVLTSFISPDDTLIAAVVRSSAPKFSVAPGQGPDYDEITDATVVISGPGRQAVLRYDAELEAYYTTTAQFTLVPGETYYMTAAVPDGKKVSASTTIPTDTLQISEFSAELRRIDRDYSNNDVYYNFVVKDQPGVTNYVAMYHRSIVVLPVDSTTEEPGYSYYDYGSAEFKDDEKTTASQYHGSGYNQVFLDSLSSVVIDLMVLNASREFYLYNRSVTQASYSGGNPFGEPVLIYSNVENGFGCFGSYRATRRQITLR